MKALSRARQEITGHKILSLDISQTQYLEVGLKVGRRDRESVVLLSQTRSLRLEVVHFQWFRLLSLE